MENHHQKQTRNCAHCGQLFIINPRVGRRHRFCSKKECDQASRAIARKKWLQKNGGKDYFNKSVSLSRIRAWRQNNPQYWRKRPGRRNTTKSEFIVSKKLARILRYVALQDTIDTNLALKIGIVSHLTGSALQDTIAKEIRRFMLRGYAILRGKLPEL